VLSVDRPVDVDVDSTVTLLLVVLKPVDSTVTLLFVVLKPVVSVDRPVDVDVDSTVTLLLVVLKPVDSTVTLLFVVLRPVLSETTPVLSVEREEPWVERLLLMIRKFSSSLPGVLVDLTVPRAVVVQPVVCIPTAAACRSGTASTTAPTARAAPRLIAEAPR
jgi:hypothetical protein